MFAANYDALSELGRAQARRLGAGWAERLLASRRAGFDAVFCGPAQRHIDTAAAVGEQFASAGLSFPAPVTVYWKTLNGVCPLRHPSQSYPGPV